MSYAPDLKNEAVRLRVEEQKSLLEISTALKIAKSTASLWLRNFPLAAEGNKKPRKKRRVEAPELKHPNAFSSPMFGKAAEHIFIAHALLRGYECSSPLSPACKYDVLVGPKLLRCQVKTISEQGKFGVKRMPVRKIGCNSKTNAKVTRYTIDHIDCFVGVDMESFEVYVVPVSDLDAYSSCISLTTLKKMGYKNNFSIFSEVA